MGSVLTRTATSDEQWRGVLNRDAGADGLFVYAVRTTGVYCRPSCPSRRPNRENVRFFGSCDEAERAGFRACRKCQPNRDQTREQDVIVRACRLIEEAVEAPSLTELAASVGLSPAHFHRVFSRAVGITPKAYARGVRAKRLRKQLQEEQTVTQSIYAAGFSTSSRCYETAPADLGMTPSAYQRRGTGQTIRHAVTESPLGPMLVAATEAGICQIEFGESAAALTEQLRSRFPAAELLPGDAGFQSWVEQVVAFIDAPQRGLALPLDIQGTAFQRQVWDALRSIPPGETVTYSVLAQRLGQPAAVRAVAGACAANRLAVAVPCHRVVRSDGRPSGYRWGLDRKERLVAQEREARKAQR